MSASLDPERSEVERTLWHTLDEAGWGDREIQEHFAEYCNRIAHELAEKIRKTEVGDLPVSQSLTGHDHRHFVRFGFNRAASLIDPEVSDG